MQTRRSFLQTIAAASALTAAGSVLPLNDFAASEEVKLTILHTNDTHSRIDPFPSNDIKYAGMGGAARRMQLIQRIRSEEKNVLLLDSGDIFQGTPYFNMYGGRIEFEVMSKMGYDASTLGNHDFDNGIAGLKRMLPYKNFPFLNVNYDFSKTELKHDIASYKIFNKQSIRIGVFGLGIELKGLVDEKNYGQIIYLDPVSAANEMAAYLATKKQCDLVICLSHLGYKYEHSTKISDEKLALQSKHIDIILGGHTHTFLDTPVAYTNLDQQQVLVAQTGWAGIRLGRIDCTFQRKLNKKNIAGSTVKIFEKSS